jgi:hypothetical protein
MFTNIKLESDARNAILHLLQTYKIGILLKLTLKKKRYFLVDVEFEVRYQQETKFVPAYRSCMIDQLSRIVREQFGTDEKTNIQLFWYNSVLTTESIPILIQKRSPYIIVRETINDLVSLDFPSCHSYSQSRGHQSR